jgi:hypothetical protein
MINSYNHYLKQSLDYALLRHQINGINVHFEAARIYPETSITHLPACSADLGLCATSAQTVQSDVFTIASRFGIGCLDEKTLSQAGARMTSEGREWNGTAVNM